MASLQTKSGIITNIDLFHGGYWIYQHNFVPTQHFLPDDFDQTAPLKQWKSQQPLGYQVIIQFEPPVEFDEETGDMVHKLPPPQLSADVVRDALKFAVSGADDSIEEYANLGDGSLLIDVWDGGSIAILWNGRDHVDVNFFTYSENFAQAKGFEKNFSKQLQGLATALRDEHPRGVGSVVSFKIDLDGGGDPHWA